MEGRDFARNYLILSRMRDETDKTIIRNNLAIIFGFNSSKGRAVSNSDLCNILADRFAVNPSTVFAWLNMSRKDVKPTMESLCRIAEALDIPVSHLLMPSTEWYDNDPELQASIKNRVNDIIGGYHP